MIIDKPAGLAVHPGPNTPDSLEDHLPALANGSFMPVATHRLDRDTSGCLAVARTRRGVKWLSAAFEERKAEKVYWAILSSLPATAEGFVDAPLKKVSTAETGWRMVVRRDGKPARTHWRVLDAATRLVEFRPETGRTHQIRVHALAGLGHALVGDPVYGNGKGAKRTMLHAAALTVPREGKPPIEAQSPLPPDFHALGFDLG